MVIEVETILQWVCTGHKPTTYQLGIIKGNLVTDTKAEVIKQVSGSWFWRTANGTWGREPNRDLALNAADTALGRVTMDKETEI